MKHAILMGKPDVANPRSGTSSRKAAFAAVALAAGAVTLPSVSGYAGASCIVSGSTDRACASEAWDESGELALDTRVTMRRFGVPYDWFDSRVLSIGFGDPLPRFCSRDPQGVVVLVR